MPSKLRIGPYRFFFYANDRKEPVHVHVQRENHIAKFWLEPVRLASSGRFRPHELIGMQRLIEKHQIKLKEAWHEYFRG
jgi:hypothetical protein